MNQQNEIICSYKPMPIECNWNIFGDNVVCIGVFWKLIIISANSAWHELSSNATPRFMHISFLSIAIILSQPLILTHCSPLLYYTPWPPLWVSIPISISFPLSLSLSLPLFSPLSSFISLPFTDEKETSFPIPVHNLTVRVERKRNSKRHQINKKKDFLS